MKLSLVVVFSALLTTAALAAPVPPKQPDACPSMIGDFKATFYSSFRNWLRTKFAAGSTGSAS